MRRSLRLGPVIGTLIVSAGVLAYLTDEGPRPCSGGHFAVDAPAAAGEQIVLHDGTLTLRDCPPAPAVIGRRSRAGDTLRATWAACGGARVHLRARVDPACTTMTGVVRAGGDARRRFHAHRVGVCGDAVVDPGEACDDGNERSGDCCTACQPEPDCQAAAS